VGAITRTGKGYLVVVAGDASDHTWRRAKSFVAGTSQQCIRLKCTKEELGFVVGRTSLAIAAITDAPLSLALVKSLGEPEKYKDAIAVLEEKVQKLKKRQAEAKAHKKNVRMGKKK
jgi:ribosomal protein L30E